MATSKAQPSFRKLRIRKQLELSSGALFGLNGVTATGVASAYTQTYSTAARTVSAVTTAAVTDSTTGTAGTTLAAGAGVSTYAVYLRAAAITGNVLLFTHTPGFKFKILTISASCVDAVTTGAKAATLTTAIAATPTTGGIVVLSGAYALGAEQASSAAVTALNTGSNSAAITVTASSVTAFVEGGFMLYIKLQNMDTADAIASLSDQATKDKADLLSAKQNGNALIDDLQGVGISG